MGNSGGGIEQIPGMEVPEAVVPAKRTSREGAGGGKAGAVKKRPAVRVPAPELKVARVAVDVSLPHLDRPFDYLVPAKLHETAVPGCRVRVRFAGQLVDGFLLERVAESDHDGRLSYLERVTSPEPVLTPEIAALAREVADRYAGTLADVLRLAIPPRHAKAEADAPQPRSPEPDAQPERSPEPQAPPVTVPPSGTDGDPAPTAPEARPEDSPSTTSTAEPEAPPAVAPPFDRNAAPAAPEPAAESAPPPPDAPLSGSPSADSDPGPEPDVERVAEVGSAPPRRDASPLAARDSGPAGSGPDVERVADVGLVSSGRYVQPFAAPSPGASSSGDRDSGVAAVPSVAVPVVEGGGVSGLSGAEVRPSVGVGEWGAYLAGGAFLGGLREGRGPRAVWTALPGGGWADAVAGAVGAALAGGRGSLVVAADGREVARIDAALTRVLGEGRHVALTAELGPAERYRRWLAVRRGVVQVVVGTRAAMFAPVERLGLVVLWDDGDDVHAEPHAPYPHPREVLALRAHRAGAGALIGGFTRTTDATQLLESGWAHPLAPDRAALRLRAPQVRPSGDDTELARDQAARSARLPQLAFRTARQGLEHGPVLVQVPRRGYVPALACSRCRGPARCTACEGPLSLTSGHAAPYCRWCGRIAGDWRCPECGNAQVRAVVVGAKRTAEELGRAFPGVPVRTSGRDGVLGDVSGEPALVVATPGAEPVAEGGYAAALLLDGWVLLGRADLRAGEEALRRWLNAAALVRPRGPVVVLADGGLPAVQALVRWDPVTYAERELAERRQLGFPPAVRMASLTGSAKAVHDLVEAAGLPPDAEVLGPVEMADGQERALARIDRARGAALAHALKAAQGARSARKTADTVRVQVDPLELI